MKKIRVSRLLSVVLMAAVSVGLIFLSGWSYTAARRPYLTSHLTEVELDGAAPLEGAEALMDTYGVVSASRALSAGGQTTGYVVVVSTRGYKSDIHTQCVFAADGETLASMKVVSQHETEYLGERVMTDAFAAPFAGRRLPLKLWGDVTLASPVDGLTGSTVSAQAVVDGVNNAHRFLQAYLQR